jgi:hypothetical protein
MEDDLDNAQGQAVIKGVRDMSTQKSKRPRLRVAYNEVEYMYHKLKLHLNEEILTPPMQSGIYATK